MASTKITLESGNILSYNGDALICFCDSELTYKKDNLLLQAFADNTKANNTYKKVISQTYSKHKEYEDQLIKELTAIGYCEIGNAVITQPSILNVKHLIFVPFTDHNNPEMKLNYILFHQAMKSALTLASLYGIRKLAIPTLRIRNPKKPFMDKVISDIFEPGKDKNLDEKELMDIMIVISKDFNDPTFEEIVIYR